MPKFKNVPPPVAGQTSTLSKHPAVFPANAPKLLLRAKGSYVWDDDSNRYIDWCAGQLAVTLGHNREKVTMGVQNHLATGGPTWSLKHPLEDLVAEQILWRTTERKYEKDWQVRFVKTGSEACSAAVRIARAVTERSVVLTSGYHGWHDTLLTTPPAWGALYHGGRVQTFEFNDFAEAERLLDDDVACIILEPETLEPPAPGFLSGLRALCHRNGALLVYDECITGGRYSPEFTAGRRYDVMPDLFVLSKGLANGYPLACVVGRAEYMQCFDLDYRDTGPVYVSGTFSGETMSLAAAQQTLFLWLDERIGEVLDGIGAWMRRELLMRVVFHGLKDVVGLKGPNWRLVLDCDLRTKTVLMEQLIAHGVLIGAGFNAMASTGLVEREKTLDAWDKALRYLKEGGEPLGRLVQTPYRQR